MKKIYLIFTLGLVGLCIILFYRTLTDPIKIAIIGNFQEERYNFETNSIIAARIAEKDVNVGNSVRGRKTKLIIRSDDFADVKATEDFLLKNKVDAVITSALSSDLIKLKPVFDENKIVCLSTGATTSTLSGQDDYIYRVIPDDKKEVNKLLRYLEGNYKKKELTIIYTTSNEEYKKSVEKSIESLGGKITLSESSSEEPLNYVPKNIEAMKNNPVLILASARDTAIIVQRLKKYGIEGNNVGMSWSGDYNLRSYGGKAIEGFKFVNPVDFSKTDGIYGQLTEKLKEYSKENGIIPSGVYEAYLIIKEAYEVKQSRHITLKQALDSIKEYKYSNEKTIFDKYGDSTGEEYIFTLKDGQFIKVEEGMDKNAQN